MSHGRSDGMHAHRREGGDLVIEALEGRGVEFAFTVSGGPINSIYHASTRSSSLRLRHVRHEAAAGFMADATYRATGRPGVAIVTLGPGVTNTVTPLATALRAGVPMLVIGGQAGTGQIDRRAGMELDTLPALVPVTKWAARVPRTERIPEYVEMAWRQMTSATPGPVYLEIPSDVLSAETETPSPAPPSQHGGAGANTNAVEAAHRTLREAARAVVLVGDGVFHASAFDGARQLIESGGYPFAPLRLARGAIDEGHRLCLGPGYTPANPTLRRALAEADAVLLLGHDWEFDLDFGAGVNPKATVVQVHQDQHALGRGGRVDHPVAADTGAFLAALPPAEAVARDTSWVEEVTTEWRSIHARTSEQARVTSGIHPITLTDEVVAAAPPDTIFVTSHGNIDFWADAHLRVHTPGRYLRAGQSGSLGAEVPFGVSAKLSRPDRPVVIFVGDGGVGYHVTELDTAARYDAPVVVVVADDAKWGAIALPQWRAYGVEVEMDLVSRDWAALASALGGHGERVWDATEIGPAVKRAVESGRPAVVQVPSEPVESPYMRYISG